MNRLGSFGLAFILALWFSHGYGKELASGCQRKALSPNAEVEISGAEADVYVRSGSFDGYVLICYSIEATGLFSKEAAKKWVEARMPVVEDLSQQVRVTVPHALGPAGVVGKAHVQVALPSGVSVSVSTTEGRINLFGDFGGSEVELKSSRGGITFEGCAGSLRVSTLHGTVKVRAVCELPKFSFRSTSGSLSFMGSVGFLEADTASGDVVCGYISEGAAVATSSGDVSLWFDGVGDAGVKVHTGTGDVELVFPDAAALSGSVKSSEGTVSVSGMETERASGGELRLAGDGPAVYVDSGSGDVSVRAANSVWQAFEGRWHP